MHRFAALALFALIGCILDGRRAGRGSEVENEVGVYGVLVDEAGKPVAGAKVKAKPAAAGVGKLGAAAAMPLNDSDLTDSKGRYSLTSLRKGDYDLLGLASAGDLVVLIPGIRVADSAKPVDVGVDTLRAPGTIRGRVLTGSQGKVVVLCFIPGSSYLAATDDSGKFALTGVPQGRYKVSYSSTGYILGTDTGVVVTSGKVTDLPPHQLEFDPSLPPPPPQGLKAEVDTMIGRITLTWHPVKVADLRDYVIYLSDPGHADPVAIASWRDTLYRHDMIVPPGETRSLRFRIRSQDSGFNQSQAFSEPAFIPEYKTDWANSIFSWISPPGEVMELPDSLHLIVRYHKPLYGTVREISWRDSATGALLRSSVHRNGAGRDTLNWKPSPGRYKLVVRLIEPGTYDTMTVSRGFFFLPKGAKPMEAGPDLTIPFLDSADLVPKTDPGFEPVSWGWSCGEGFMDWTGPRIRIRSGFMRDGAVCIVRARDSSGLAASDTLTIHFERPAGLPWKQLQAKPAFPGRFETGFATFKNRLWVVGGRGQVFRFQDEYSVFFTDVWSSLDGAEWTKSTDTAPFGYRFSPTVIGYAGKLWLMGGGDMNSRLLTDVWNSEDGSEWTRILDSLPESLRIASSVVFRDRLWIFATNGPVFAPGDAGNPTYLKEAWSTSDGREWAREAAEMAFLPKSPVVAPDGALLALDSLGRIRSTRDGRSWSEGPALPEGANFQVIAFHRGELLGIGSMAEKGGAIYRLKSGGGFELVQDNWPFPNYFVYTASLNERLFVFGSAERDEFSISEIWGLP